MSDECRLSAADLEAVVQLLGAFEEELLSEWHGTRGFNGRMRAADPARLMLGLPPFVPCPGYDACDCCARYGETAIRSALAADSKGMLGDALTGKG